MAVLSLHAPAPLSSSERQPNNKTGRPSENLLHIGLLLWPHFSLLALSGLLEALRYAAQATSGDNHSAFTVSLLSERPATPIVSSAGISVMPDNAHVSPDTFNYIAAIGGSVEALQSGYPGDRHYLARAHQFSVPLIGIGTGSFILAQEGLLNERRVSIHPRHLARFRRQFPEVYAEEGYDFIDEGDVLTCPGGVSTLTLATELIHKQAGAEVAASVSQRLSLAWRVGQEATTPQPPGIARIADLRLRRAVLLIEQSLTRPLTTAWLAGCVRLSERQLNRLFNAEFSQSPREFIRSARLRYACWLLKNSAQSISEIARRLRFSDGAHFIRHFQTEYGCTPGAWRAAQG